LPDIEDVLKSHGENVKRPKYDGSRGELEEGENDKEEKPFKKKERVSGKKANIEATSDEDED